MSKKQPQGQPKRKSTAPKQRSLYISREPAFKSTTTTTMLFLKNKAPTGIAELCNVLLINIIRTAGEKENKKSDNEEQRLCESSSNLSAPAKTWQCLKATSLYLFDDVTSRDVVPIWRGVRFVRLSSTKPNHDDVYKTDLYSNSEFLRRKDTQYLTWFDRLALSFTRLLLTHKLEIDLKEVMDAYMEYRRENEYLSNANYSDPIGTARHRRQRYNMMITMMFGVTAFGAVLVPMGFQLLSVVSGKALLLAKMALLLASINGLKRVANTGLHYGLYHVPGEHYGGYYDRGDVHHPRNVQNLLTPTNQIRGIPVEVGINVK
ncbi:DUF1676 domain-containing protein Osi23 [Musca autumnalis]|uniref:DUF1676 domain-containing protein Osi23 n=1 Tax=Musca autumnalis TaxID=221902 RepID=UPI003CF5B181